jgi:hypothetical protein
MSEIITLYHGTFHDFASIDVSRGKPFKDFGRGFYASRSLEQARNLAMRNLGIEKRRLRRINQAKELCPYIYSYELDLSRLGPFKTKIFETADAEWVRFVAMNRTSEDQRHDFDVVFGPTANDKTLSTVQLYLSGSYGPMDGDEAVGFFLRRIEPDKLPWQVFFGTQRAANLLDFKGRNVQ